MKTASDQPPSSIIPAKKAAAGGFVLYRQVR